MALVTFLDAKAHLRVTTDDQNADIALKLEQASAMVVTHLNTTVTWTAATAPADVRAVVLLVLAWLFEHRGDDPKAVDELDQVMKLLLVPHTTSALA